MRTSTWRRAPAGENEVALAPGYAANVEIASADAAAGRAGRPASTRPRRSSTPGPDDGRRRRARRSASPPARCSRRSRSWSSDRGMVLVLVRGDHRVNEIKLAERARRRPSARRTPEEMAERIGPGRVHRPGRRATSRSCSTTRVGRDGRLRDRRQQADAPPARRRAGPRLRLRARPTCAASRPGDTRRRAARSASSRRSRSATSSSSARATPSRSAPPTSTRTAASSRSGWAPTGSGRRASSPPRSSSSPTSTASPGRARWRRSTSSWSALGKPGTDERALAERLYDELREAGLDVLYDDRDAGPGEKFADAELLGCPLRRDGRAAHAGVRRARGPGAPRPRDARSVRARRRRRRRWPSCGGRSRSDRAPGRASGRYARRCSGLDRSGPPPPETRAGAAAAPVDDPQRDRLRPPGADPGLPRRSPCQQRRRARRAARRSLRASSAGATTRRHRRPRDRPVQPPRRAPGPGHRPAAGDLRRRRLLALRAAAALGAGGAGRARAGRCSCSARVRHAARRRARDQLARARLGVWPVMSAPVLRDGRASRLAEVLLYVGLALSLAALRCTCATACASTRAHTLKLSLTPAPAGAILARSRDRAHQEGPHGHLSRPRLADRPGAQGPHPAAHRGGDGDLLPASHPPRQDRHPARRAGQPPAQEARGRRGRDHRRRRPAAHRHPRRQGPGRRRRGSSAADRAAR